MDDYRDISSQTRNQDGRYQGHYVRRKPSKRKQRRKQQMLVALIAIIMIIVTILLFVIFGNVSNNELLGVWQYDQYTQYEFSDKHEGCLCVDDVHYEYTYRVSGKTITLDFTDDVVRDCEYTYSIENGVLTLVGGEGTDKGTYKLNKLS